MAEWQHFKLNVDRVPDKDVYTEADRQLLEQAVSVRTDRLLGLFGRIVTESVDVRVLDEERHITESLEYDFIKLLPFLLMDESQLEIGQFNFVNETYNTEPGVHFIEHTDEDGVILRHFIVRHAKSIQRPFVKNEDGSRVDIPILGELYEALMALERDLVQNEPVNRNPIDVTQYPRLSLDIEFDMIVTNPSL